MKKEIIIDAKGQKLGRVASQIAFSLRGKTEADFQPNRKEFPMVIVKNVDSIDFSQKKLKAEFFKTYSGYPGGLKERRTKEIAARDPREVLKHAIRGMIKRNRLKDHMIKNIHLYHGNEK